jgi:hypothetical protein
MNLAPEISCFSTLIFLFNCLFGLIVIPLVALRDNEKLAG